MAAAVIAALAVGMGLAVISVAYSFYPGTYLDNPFTTWVAMNAAQCANPWDEEEQSVAEYFIDGY